MPYAEHPEFRAPASSSATIWRYLTLSKFLAVLVEGSLFFSRGDLLGDPLEGSFPKLNPDSRLAELQKALPGGAKQAEEMARRMETMHRLIRSRVAVNCWRVDEHESAAMWKLYTSEVEGIAIKSTFARLTTSLASAPQHIHVGVVNYIDYWTTVLPEGNVFTPFIHKRKSYEYESELRAASMLGGPVDFHDLSRPMAITGLAIPVDVEGLVGEIVVSPAAPAWFVETVKTTISRFGFEFPVRQSDLNTAALY